MIGNIITSMVSSQVTSLQLGLSALLFRHRKLIDELHAYYGVTSRYDELSRHGKLIDELHAYGVTSRYDELRRYQNFSSDCNGIQMCRTFTLCQHKKISAGRC